MQIDGNRRTLNAIERSQRLPPLETTHRIADTLDSELDDVFRYESELTVNDDEEPERWKSDDVSRVTTSAKRCSDAAL